MSKINETNYPRRTQANYADTDMLVLQAAGGNTYTTRIEDLRDDYEATLAPTIDKINDALAPAENGATASQSYAIGEHFMRDGAFCTAIAAITSGGSFTLNTNYKVDDVANNLEQLNSDIVAMKGKHNVVFYATCPPSTNYGACRITFGGNFTGVTITLKSVYYRDGTDPNVVDITSSSFIAADSSFPRALGFCLQITNPPCLGKYLLITVDFD